MFKQTGQLIWLEMGSTSECLNIILFKYIFGSTPHFFAITHATRYVHLQAMGNKRNSVAALVQTIQLPNQQMRAHWPKDAYFANKPHRPA